MDVLLFIAGLAVIGSLNPCLEDKWSDGWGKYLAGWWQRFLGLTALFGLANWLGKTQLDSQWHIAEHFVMNLGIMLFLNGVISKCVIQEKNQNEEMKRTGCYDSDDYSDWPIGMVATGTTMFIAMGLIWLIRHFILHVD